MNYRIAGYFRGVLIFVIFVVHLLVTKISTHENNPLYGRLLISWHRDYERSYHVYKDIWEAMQCWRTANPSASRASQTLSVPPVLHDTWSGFDEKGWKASVSSLA